MRIICEVCKQQAYLQQIVNNYFRCRHYKGRDSTTGKSKFYYHKQSKEYAKSQLSRPVLDKNIKKLHLEHLNSNEHSDFVDSRSFSCGCSIVWLELQLPKLITRVQIPATAPTTFLLLQLGYLIHSYSQYSGWIS